MKLTTRLGMVKRITACSARFRSIMFSAKCSSDLIRTGSAIVDYTLQVQQMKSHVRSKHAS